MRLRSLEICVLLCVPFVLQALYKRALKLRENYYPALVGVGNVNYIKALAIRQGAVNPSGRLSGSVGLSSKVQRPTVLCLLVVILPLRVIFRMASHLVCELRCNKS